MANIQNISLELNVNYYVITMPRVLDNIDLLQISWLMKFIKKGSLDIVPINNSLALKSGVVRCTYNPVKEPVFRWSATLANKGETW